MTSELKNEKNSTIFSLNRWSKITLLKYAQTFTYCSFFCVSAVLLIIQAIQSVQIYLKGPTYTETLLHNQENTTFPVITICPLENGYKESILKVKEYLTYYFTVKFVWFNEAL